MSLVDIVVIKRFKKLSVLAACVRSFRKWGSECPRARRALELQRACNGEAAAPAMLEHRRRLDKRGGKVTWGLLRGASRPGLARWPWSARMARQAATRSVIVTILRACHGGPLFLPSANGNRGDNLGGVAQVVVVRVGRGSSRRSPESSGGRRMSGDRNVDLS